MPVAVRQIPPVGHLVGADQVAPAQLDRVEAQLARGDVHEALGDEHGLRAAGAAVGRARHLVRDHDAAAAAERGQAIEPDEVRGRHVGHHRAAGQVGAGVDQEVVGEREDAAVAVEGERGGVHLVARVRGAQEARRAACRSSARRRRAGARAWPRSAPPGYTGPLVPKPPPTSGAVTRTRVERERRARRPRAAAPRTASGCWTRGAGSASTGSQRAATARGSSGSAVTRPQRKRRVTTTAARARARRRRRRSPARRTRRRSSPQSAWTSGRAGLDAPARDRRRRAAARTRRARPRRRRSPDTASVATTTATGSPAKRTTPSASAD